MALGAVFRLQSRFTRKPDDSDDQEPRRWGARKRALPASRGPETGTIPIRAVNSMHLLRHVKGLVRAAQDSNATAQGCLLMGQVKTASAQAWKRKWHLVRSFSADDSVANS